MKKVLAVALGLVLAAMGCSDDSGTGGTGGGAGAGAGGVDGAGGRGGTAGMGPPSACEGPAPNPLITKLYDVTSAVFKPFNPLFEQTTGSGNPLSDCAVPDLSGNPGASPIVGGDRCQIIAIGGCMRFDESSPRNFQVTGENSFFFVSDVIVPEVSSRLVIQSDFVLTFSGTATGTFPGGDEGNPGMITLNDLPGGFNIDAVATGNANCQATSTITGLDVSEQVCATITNGRLQAGDNALPFSGDPGMRTLPPIILGLDNTFQLGGEVVPGTPGTVVGGGASDPEGWYLLNPAPMINPGNQWISLAGTCTNC